MKIKFLGTSAGWPLPRLGCNDKICTSKDQRDTRTRSQALVNNFLLLDAGPETYTHLKNSQVDPTKIKYAAITHEHLDHTFGLWDLSHIYTGKGRLKPKIFIHPRTLSKIRFMFFPNEYEITEIEASKKFYINDLWLTFLPVNHTKYSSFGILVEERNKKIFWAPDFKTLPLETSQQIRGAELLIIDGSELKVKTAGHETIEEGIALGKKIQAKNTYFVHIGHRTLPHKELEDFVQKEGGKNSHIAYDGLEVNF